MKITKEQAVAVLTGIGFKTSAKWPIEKLQKKIKLLHTIVDEDTTTNDDKLDELMDEIISTDEVDVICDKKKAKKPSNPEVEEEVEPEKKKKIKKAEKSSITETKKKEQPKKTEKKISTKEKIWKLYEKIDLKNIEKHVQKWIEENSQVKPNTIKGWINSWKNGNNLPAAAKKES